MELPLTSMYGWAVGFGRFASRHSPTTSGGEWGRRAASTGAEKRCSLLPPWERRGANGSPSWRWMWRSPRDTCCRYAWTWNASDSNCYVARCGQKFGGSQRQGVVILPGGRQQWWNFILPTTKLREKHFSTKKLIVKYQISKSWGSLGPLRRPWG